MKLLPLLIAVTGQDRLYRIVVGAVLDYQSLLCARRGPDGAGLYQNVHAIAASFHHPHDATKLPLQPDEALIVNRKAGQDIQFVADRVKGRRQLLSTFIEVLMGKVLVPLDARSDMQSRNVHMGKAYDGLSARSTQYRADSAARCISALSRARPTSVGNGGYAPYVPSQ
jgi:hypothetical protein